MSIGNNKPVNSPKLVKGIKNKIIKNLATGGQHTALVTSDGELYVSGSTRNGILINNRKFRN